METLDAIRTRRSIRKFKEEPVDPALVSRFLEAATHAPSGGNRQPWRFVVTTDREKTRQFDPYAHQPWVDQAPVVVAVCADPHDTWARYDENDACWLLDTAAAIQTMLLAIHDLGLGAVWVLTFSKKEVRRLLEIPLHWQIVSLVCVGHFEETGEVEYKGGVQRNAAPRSRRPLPEVAFRETPSLPIDGE